ncbi:hypothetical protein [Shewanella violacea]|uniref:Uncharacterized protein n=1 Tax=Shewanella violacea (strain JCM 10179 / CIP 106290 / LMG 19151 / DSS12) TaxID=637905 RepID=D4ZBN7_SHEVD|nr:hypothetical protein [Shewanella violacea]BAJ03432.1 hypothetical protein SVI_3461 [Shewanella violacea DSS12]
MKPRLGLIFCLLIIMSGIAYHFLSPQILVKNLSDRSFYQVSFSLPDKQITLDTIQVNSRQTIYFSPQEKTGIVTYQLIAINGDQVAQGHIEYQFDDNNLSQFGTKLSFIIDEQYRVSFSSNK